jgi:hypothetical protein
MPAMMMILRALSLLAVLGSLACGGGSSAPAGGIHLNQTMTVILTEDGFQFSAVDDAGQPLAATWTVVEGTAGGTVDAQGYYIAPATPGTYHVTASRGAAQATATIQAVAGTPDIVITPGGTPRLAVGGSQLFRAPINNLANQGVSWSLSGAGQLDADGYFTASSLPGTSTITATSLADPSLKKELQVVVEPPSQPNFSLLLAFARFPGNTTIPFTQGLSGTSDTRLAWTLTGGGTVNPDGVVTLPTQPGTVQLQVRSVAAPAVVQTLPIEVIPSTDPVKVTVQISPATLSLAPGATATFTATVGGLPPRRRAVMWWIQEGRGLGGVLTSGGQYTAPTQPGTYHVVVTPLAETRIRAIATVVVGP